MSGGERAIRASALRLRSLYNDLGSAIARVANSVKEQYPIVILPDEDSSGAVGDWFLLETQQSTESLSERSICVLLMIYGWVVRIEKTGLEGRTGDFWVQFESGEQVDDVMRAAGSGRLCYGSQAMKCYRVNEVPLSA